MYVVCGYVQKTFFGKTSTSKFCDDNVLLTCLITTQLILNLFIFKVVDYCFLIMFCIESDKIERA